MNNDLTSKVPENKHQPVGISVYLFREVINLPQRDACGIIFAPAYGDVPIFAAFKLYKL